MQIRTQRASHYVIMHVDVTCIGIKEFSFCSVFYYFIFILCWLKRKTSGKKKILLMVGDKMAHRIGQLGVRSQRKAFL